MKTILVWDLPTRLFHGLLAACFVAAWVSSSSDRWLSIHIFSGYLMLGLIGFRVVWGFVGGRYARFKSFVASPRAGLRYLLDLVARRDTPYLGHNPAASQAIVAMLLLGVAVGLTGVFTQGGEERQGVVPGLLSIDAAGWLKDLHEALAILMAVTVVGHLSGIALGTWLHHENLPLTMLTGTKHAPDDAQDSKAFHATAAAMVLAIAVFAGWWFFYAWHQPVETSLGLGAAKLGAPHVPFVGRTLADDGLWRAECSSCHLAFHPNLLPIRSWKLIIASQAEHFGTDLALDTPTASAVLTFLTRNAAENSTTEAAFKINRSVPAGVTPTRITETPYWIAKHQDVDERVWQLPQVKSRSNCAACHMDAVAGTFEDAAMRIPRPSPGQTAASASPALGR